MARRNLHKSAPILPIREVARLLNIHVNTARRWSDSGILRSYRIGPRGDRRFSREDIVAMLQEEIK
ncbi:MAG TPA: helix-turn-helix domain-containing protein [Dehalococcoidia bacterium]|nr:helix-turn-helix domain-containing protein [Dehalococcoidia bacterium]